MTEPEIKTVLTMTLLEATGMPGLAKDLTLKGYPDGHVYLERKWIHPSRNDKSQFDLSDWELRLLGVFKEVLDSHIAARRQYDPEHWIRSSVNEVPG